MGDSAWDRARLEWLMQSRMTLILLGEDSSLEWFLH